MDIEVLGPLEARAGGVSVAPTAAKPRKVLAMLAVHAGEVVPMTALSAELWGEQVPRSAVTNVQTYVLHLRHLIGAALRRSGADVADAKRILVTYPGGYSLDTMGGRVDVRDFDRLAAVGHRARELGDFEAASKSFTEALGIWRGRALVDVQTGSLLEVEAHRLEEARLNVLDRRIDADLRLGRHHGLLGELAGLVGHHPTHEGLHAHLMVALYRAGRRAEAIDVYRRLRTCLVGKLGLEPSPGLRRLQQAILGSDPHLDEPGPGAEAAAMVLAAG